MVHAERVPPVTPTESDHSLRATQPDGTAASPVRSSVDRNPGTQCFDWLSRHKNAHSPFACGLFSRRQRDFSHHTVRPLGDVDANGIFCRSQIVQNAETVTKGVILGSGGSNGKSNLPPAQQACPVRSSAIVSHVFVSPLRKCEVKVRDGTPKIVAFGEN